MIRFTIAALFLIMCFSACKEFIEPSLNNVKVYLVAPADLTESNQYQQQFWWEPVQDALKYRVQIVTPDFSHAAKVIADTIIRADKFLYTLEPGNYEWRVRAENGSSVSAYTVNRLTIFPSSLKDQSVQLQSPANDSYFNNAAITYQWLKLYGATQYRLQVDNKSFADPANLILDQVTDNLSFTQTLTLEGTFQYRVRAENSTENSNWSPVRSFTFDATPPAKVALLAPINNQSVTKPVKLTWNAAAGADKYELSVYRSDFSTPLSSTFPLTLSGTEYTLNTGDPGQTLTWRVRAVDKAGNKGPYSDFNSFILQ